MDVHPRVPGNAIVRSFLEGGHQLTVADDSECEPDAGSQYFLRLGGRRDVAAAREAQDARQECCPTMHELREVPFCAQVALRPGRSGRTFGARSGDGAGGIREPGSSSRDGGR
jgi:hypothetical protein